MASNSITLILGKLKENKTFESTSQSREKYRDELQRIPDLFQ